MGELVRPRNVTIDGAKTSATARGHAGRIEFYGDLGTYEGYDKLKWGTWKFKDIDASVRDGALIEIEPGGRTPLELVKANKVFSEVPMGGELVFIHMDTRGSISAYHFDSRRENDKSILFNVTQGEAFCWVALGNEMTEVLEYEEPGFTDSDLERVKTGAKEASGRQIPDDLWILIDQLERGQIKDTVVPISEIGELQLLASA